MASISSLGVGSGLDIKGLVENLIAAEGAGKTNRLNVREAEYTAKLSIIGSVKGALRDFQSSYSSLKLSSTFKSHTATSSDSSAFTATASNSSVAATYSLTINQIAQAHKMKTIEFADQTTSIGTGTLQFIQGDGTTTDVTITDGSLQGVRDSINAANAGIDASIIFNGTGYVLSMASTTGTDKAITSITATATSTGALTNFETGADPLVNLSDIQVANDAIFSVNGVSITSQSNTVSNIIDNVTLELKAGDGGIAANTLTVGRDTSAVETAVQEFVDGYNGLITGLNSATFYDSDTAKSGVLIGDPTVRGVVTQLRGLLNTTTGNALTQYNSFASIGILTARDGTLEYDPTKLKAALASKPDEVQELLAGGSGTTSAIGIDVVGVTDNIGAGTYAVDITSAPTQATYQSNALTATGGTFNLNAVALADREFSVVIDGVSSATLSLTATNHGGTTLAKGQSIAAEIQAAINGDATISGAGSSVAVTFAEIGVSGTYSFSITSAKMGTASTVELIPGAGAASYLSTGLNITGNSGSAATGVDRTGTIGGQAATFVGDRMTGSGLYAGFVLDITDPTANGLYSIKVAGGNISKLDTLIDSFLQSDGMFDGKTKGLTASIADITAQREALDLRLDAMQSRLIKQFSAMDSLVAQMNSTSSFLSGQLEQISKIGQK